MLLLLFICFSISLNKETFAFRYIADEVRDGWDNIWSLMERFSNRGSELKSGVQHYLHDEVDDMTDQCLDSGSRTCNNLQQAISDLENMIY